MFLFLEGGTIIIHPTRHTHYPLMNWHKPKFDNQILVTVGLKYYKIRAL